jgi:hypothetical protein
MCEVNRAGEFAVAPPAAGARGIRGRAESDDEGDAIAVRFDGLLDELKP